MTGKKKVAAAAAAPTAQDVPKVTRAEVKKMTPEQQAALEQSALDDLHSDPLFDDTEPLPLEAIKNPSDRMQRQLAGVSNELIEQSVKNIRKAIDEFNAKNRIQFDEIAKSNARITTELWQPIAEQLHTLVDGIVNSQAYRMLQTIQQSWKAYYEANKDQIDAMVKAAAEIRKKEEMPYIEALTPFILEELAADNGIDDPDKIPFNIYAAVLRQGFDDDGQPVQGGQWENLIQRAIRKKAAQDKVVQTKKQLDAVANALQPGNPQWYLMTTHNFDKTIHTQGVVGTGLDYDLTVRAKNKRRKEVNVLLKVDFNPKDKNIKLTGNHLTWYDWAVSNAIASLYEYGPENHIITTDMIYRAMTATTEAVPKKQKKMIEKSIACTEGVYATLNLTNEARMREWKDDDGNPLDKLVLEGRLLNVNKVVAETCGRRVVAWQILDEPLSLKYAKMNGQYRKIKPECLAMRSSNTRERIEVKEFLIQSISTMKSKKANNKKWTNVILFDTMFKELGLKFAEVTIDPDDPKSAAAAKKVADNNRRLKKKYTDFATTYLEHLRNIYDITDYRVRRGPKNKIDGVEIIL